MPGIALSGHDTIILNNRSLVDLADGNCAELTFPNEIGNVKTGKNGNSIFGQNTSGRQGELKVRLLRASADDKFLQSLYAQQIQNFSGFVLLIGRLIKKIGDGKGNIASDTYYLDGGIFIKPIEAKTNVEGETEQSVAIWTMRFANAQRAIS